MLDGISLQVGRPNWGYITTFEFAVNGLSVSFYERAKITGLLSVSAYE